MPAETSTRRSIPLQYSGGVLPNYYMDTIEAIEAIKCNYIIMIAYWGDSKTGKPLVKNRVTSIKNWHLS